MAALQAGASDWGFDVDVDDEEDNGQEAAEVEHEAGYSAELSDYDLSPLSDVSALRLQRASAGGCPWYRGVRGSSLHTVMMKALQKA